ncbi:hypothetical protein EOI86_18480 [Hwanghaeella grinnelliae]|uniref:Uncharacterized protein n=1 Tax=Hwanghaeella grinnelliae TaxID=2500179 RepID=A0A437QJY6_9PROT|nr:hypothetical protein [Hwanghaeella grinnelliae]RVU34830.1 hypothetical protein EOI86_18480 [Hwanghaeella grinnelliae]
MADKMVAMLRDGAQMAPSTPFRGLATAIGNRQSAIDRRQFSTNNKKYDQREPKQSFQSNKIFLGKNLKKKMPYRSNFHMRKQDYMGFYQEKNWKKKVN